MSAGWGRYLMNTTKPAPVASDKDKVMIYVPSDVHRAMKIFAVERGCPASALYVDAARDYLQAHERSIPRLPEPLIQSDETAPEIGPGDFMDRLGQIAEAIALVLQKLEEPTVSKQIDSKTAEPRNAEIAGFMRTILKTLANAGPNGISMPELDQAMRGTKLKISARRSDSKTGFEENAKSALMQSGFMHNVDGRWYLGPQAPPWTVF